MSSKKWKYRNPEALDPAKRSEAIIDKVLEQNEEAREVTILDSTLKQEQESRREKIKEEVQNQLLEDELMVKTVPISKELKGEHVIDEVQDRNDARVLILTRNEHVFSEGSLAQSHIRELSNMFAEVHVLVLAPKRGKEQYTVRVTANTWVYATNSRYWFTAPFDAQGVARKQLVFADGFRPDVIVAEDPFESGVAGYWLAQKYDRPFQIHVLEDYFDSRFQNANPHNGWRLFMATYALGRADTVRTRAEAIREKILQKFPDLTGFTEVLPTYFNLEAWRDAEVTVDLRKKYPQFTFFIAHVSSMTSHSHTDKALNGIVHILLQYPTIGCVIIGDGPMRHWIEKHVEKLGIEHNVVYEEDGDDTLSFLKKANVLLYTSEDSEDEKVILEAAAVGLPIVSRGSGIASGLFKDNESALLCSLDNPACFGNNVKRLLNDNHIRLRLAENARETVFNRIEQDYSEYLKAYRASIERGVT
jgi:glycosyltransferase involved in cell wall biosynthesis